LHIGKTQLILLGFEHALRGGDRACRMWVEIHAPQRDRKKLTKVWFVIDN
jgi:hypothetical protein